MRRLISGARCVKMEPSLSYQTLLRELPIPGRTKRHFQMTPKGVLLGRDICGGRQASGGRKKICTIYFSSSLVNTTEI